MQKINPVYNAFDGGFYVDRRREHEEIEFACRLDSLRNSGIYPRLGTGKLAEIAGDCFRHLGFASLDFRSANFIIRFYYNIGNLKLLLDVISIIRKDSFSRYLKIIRLLKKALKMALIDIRIRSLFSNLILINIASRLEETRDDPAILEIAESIIGGERQYMEYLHRENGPDKVSMQGIYYYLSLLPVNCADWKNRHFDIFKDFREKEEKHLTGMIAVRRALAQLGKRHFNEDGLEMGRGKTR